MADALSCKGEMAEPEVVQQFNNRRGCKIPDCPDCRFLEKNQVLRDEDSDDSGDDLADPSTMPAEQWHTGQRAADSDVDEPLRPPNSKSPSDHGLGLPC